MFAFNMTAAIAEEFYRRVEKLNAITEEQRVNILIQMTEEGLIKEVLQADISKAQFAELLSEDYKVLDMTDKAEPGPDSLGTAGN